MASAADIPGDSSTESSPRLVSFVRRGTTKLTPLWVVVLLCGLAPTFGAAQNADSSVAAQNAVPPPLEGKSQSQTTAKSGQEISEIIVTAEKRNERLQDTPVPVSVLSATPLVETNEVHLADYSSQVPGLTIANSVQSSQLVTIRGITTGSAASTPTVAVMIDGIPFGATTLFIVPDFEPSELARIEVLRGPQGTLYGASSLGGLVNYVTAEPTTDRIRGEVQASTSSVYNGAELGYTFRASVNLPLTSDLAVRISGFTRRDPGYIDNPVLHIDGINVAYADGGLISALWRPSDSFSLRLFALYQEIRGEGTNDVTGAPVSAFPLYSSVTPAAPAHLQQAYVAGVGGYQRGAQAYGLTLDDQLGKVHLTSVTGYNVDSLHDSFDFTSALGGLSQAVFGVVGENTHNMSDASRVTEELRLAAPLGEKLELLFGGYYDHENVPFSQSLLTTNPTTGAVAGELGYDSVPSTYEEYAAFADLTYHFTSQFDIQLGGRESHIIVRNAPVIFTGPFVPLAFGVPSPFLEPAANSSNTAFTYLATPRFKITPDWMVYARLASGYRPGGPNIPSPGNPSAFAPDKTFDYEIGTKASFLGDTLSVDASVYYIDWKNIQLGLVNPATQITYTGNGSAAKSEGVELSITSKPVAGLTLAGWIAWNEAVLTKAIPNAGVDGVVFGFPGDRLPQSPRISGYISANEEFRLSGAATGFMGGSVNYIGGREDVFSSASPQRQYLPPYARVDVLAGVKFEPWTTTLYVNNAADRRGLISGGLANIIPYSYYYIQPRTVGISLSRKF
jgi:iron complex outermembrane receptor protein